MRRPGDAGGRRELRELGPSGAGLKGQGPGREYRGERREAHGGELLGPGQLGQAGHRWEDDEVRRGRREGGPPQACQSEQAGCQSDDGEHHAPHEAGHGEPDPWERDEHRLGDDGGRRARHAAGPAERGQ